MISRLFLLFLISSLAFSQSRRVSDAEVARVQKQVLLIDTHNDVTSFTVEGFDIGSRAGKTMTDLSADWQQEMKNEAQVVGYTVD